MTTFVGEFRIMADARRIFAALTESRAVRTWWSEHASVEPRTGGAFALWGRFTPWIEDEALADGTCTRVEAGRAIAVRWSWRGEANEASITLTERDGVTTIAVRHETRGDLGFGDEAPWLLADYWLTAMGNLRAYLATGAALVRPDFRDRSGDVVLTVELDAPPPAVWRALTSAPELNRWIARDARVVLTVGGAYSYGWTAGANKEPSGPGTLLDFVPERMLDHDWWYPHEAGANGEPEGTTSVRWELHPVEDACTRVILRHRRPPFDDPRIRAAYQLGWASFLVLLKDHVEAPPIPLRARA
ncbi:MAG: SRPBCC domain-containing protein [Phycisphaerae bacterium]|nr:SRPBCC domain-containing protein [Phycisphaerae bacterium]